MLVKLDLLGWIDTEEKKKKCWIELRIKLLIWKQRLQFYI